MQWYRADLHLHTPASADHKQPDASYIDILRHADQRGLDIIAFTDHNTVGGYAGMMQEIERLSYLEELGRAQAEELRLLAEYRRLLDKILVLPGFEFTATLGFHVLGIFAPDTPVRYLEHLLLTLNIPPEVLDAGDSVVGASADVLTAYRLINEAGGLVIAAHANSTHGVAMKGLGFGGQTRIAYTQDRNLHALELTDLGRHGRTSTQRFFDGTKPEYPRRMHCIQGSDAHSLDAYTEGKIVRPGIGDRITEVLLPERSFAALLGMFQSTDFSRTRPYNPDRKPYDYIQAAREEGPSLIQSFHETMDRKGNKLQAIIADVCAFANTNGGTIYIGIGADVRKKPPGVPDIQQAIDMLYKEIDEQISPHIRVEIDAQETQGKQVIRILVPYGEERPYAISDNRIFVRDEAETSLAVRDEIVNLVRQGMVFREAAAPPPPASEEQLPLPPAQPPPADTTAISPPRSGVEIVQVERRGDTDYYVMHDLRNGNTVQNVTRKSARKLWHYAIKQWEGNPVRPEKARWLGEIGLWRSYRKGGETRYDLIQRDGDRLRVYYGVTESGMSGPWEAFLLPENGPVPEVH